MLAVGSRSWSWCWLDVRELVEARRDAADKLELLRAALTEMESTIESSDEHTCSLAERDDRSGGDDTDEEDGLGAGTAGVLLLLEAKVQRINAELAVRAGLF